jgi:hypothetical protein
MARIGSRPDKSVKYLIVLERISPQAPRMVEFDAISMMNSVRLHYGVGGDS